jgi:hypothetical protein
LAIDTEEYLPIDTLAWCVARLAEINIDLPSLVAASANDHGLRTHVEAYLHLRTVIQLHIANGNMNPSLSLSPKPIGGLNQMMRNGSRLGELIRENYDAAEAARGEQEDDIEIAGLDYEVSEDDWDEGGEDEGEALDAAASGED